MPQIMDNQKLLERITVNPKIFNGKPIVRGRRLAVDHVLGMLAAGDTPETMLFTSSMKCPIHISKFLAKVTRKSFLGCVGRCDGRPWQY